MGRDAILHTIPPEEQLRTAPPYRHKEAAENLIGAVLDALDADRREPDQWEAELLVYAIGCITSRWYFASITSAAKALTPSEERDDSTTWERNDQTPTKRALRDALDYIAGMPAPNA